MIKVVLDTNLFVSGAISCSGNPDKILRAWQEARFILVISESIIKEIEKVLRYPKIQKKYYLEEKDIQEIIESLWIDAQVTPGRLKVNLIIDDPSDNKFLSCACEGKADYIVTGDKHLLKIKEYKGIKILNPRKFLEELRKRR